MPASAAVAVRWLCPQITNRTSEPCRTSARSSGCRSRRNSVAGSGEGIGGWCSTSRVPCGAGSRSWSASQASWAGSSLPSWRCGIVLSRAMMRSPATCTT
ncbi:Uncharacterised protein [Mycobacteroides abscessus subsp. abscessus]|nr:Uncharacterised protein [Mycobacteroides abscessus subsp. abscessus]